MLTIRLTRKGKKNQPFFRVVVIDKRRSAKGGRAVEILGYVDPLTKKKSLKKERILYWISKGAQPSDTVHNLLVSEKIINAKKINVSKKSKKAGQSAPAPVPVTPKTETSAAPPVIVPVVVMEKTAPANQVASTEHSLPVEVVKEEPKAEPPPSTSASAEAMAGNKAIEDKKKPAEPLKP